MYRRVWRVENKHHEGPYQNFRGRATLLRHGHDPDDIVKHPALIDWGLGWERDWLIGGHPVAEDPTQEVLLKLAMSEDWQFGFPTEKSAHDWFTEHELRALKREGFDLVQTRAESWWVSPSGKQVLFQRG